VGAVDAKGVLAPFSNRGLSSMVYASGVGVEMPFPLPGSSEGSLGESSGSSTAAPLVAGRALGFFRQGLSLAEVTRRLRTEFKAP